MKVAVVLSMALAAFQFMLADDFKTITGREYKDATVRRVEPDGIVLKTKSGISKVYFRELPKEVQERFLPSPAKAIAPERGRQVIDLKNQAKAVANPTSFVLLCVGGVALIAAAAFVIVRNRLQR